MNETSENLINGNITEIMQSAYIDYSMSVIVSRALPDVRDGFKPVQGLSEKFSKTITLMVMVLFTIL